MVMVIFHRNQSVWTLEASGLDSSFRFSSTMVKKIVSDFEMRLYRNKLLCRLLNNYEFSFSHGEANKKSNQSEYLYLLTLIDYQLSNHCFSQKVQSFIF